MAQPEPLKAYEREIVRARARVSVSDLDNEIDKLIAIIIGKLTKIEHMHYQAARLTGLMTATPEAIVERRAILLDLSDQEMIRLSAPDVLTMEEMAALVVIMRAISDWLKTCQEDGLVGVTLDDLIAKADEQALAALGRFKRTYQRSPNIDDVPESLMKLPRARSIKNWPIGLAHYCHPIHRRSRSHERYSTLQV